MPLRAHSHWLVINNVGYQIFYCYTKKAYLCKIEQCKLEAVHFNASPSLIYFANLQK